MAITELSRDWGSNPSIVRIVSTDSLAVCMGSTYLVDQATVIEGLNNGVFEWKASDSVLLSSSDGNNLLKYDLVTGVLVATSPLVTSVVMTAAEVIAAYATPKLLVDAPSADQYHSVTGVQYIVDYGSAQYTTGGVAGVQYDATANGAGVLTHVGVAAAVLNGVTADFLIGAAGVNIAGTTGGTAATIAGKGLYFSNKTAAFAAGDSPVTVVITYATVVAGL